LGQRKLNNWFKPGSLKVYKLRKKQLVNLTKG